MCSPLRFVPRLLIAAFLAHPGVAAAIPGTWLPVTTPGATPPPRMSHGFAWDGVHQRAVAFSGYGYGSPLYDVWSLSLSGVETWAAAQVPTTVPSYRYESSLLHDPVADRFVLFGGKSPSQWFDDAWVLEPHSTFMTWTELQTNTPPSPRETRGVYDPVRHRMLYFGGYGPGLITNELWMLTTMAATGTWGLVETSATRPDPRNAHAMVYDPAGDQLVVIGGITPNPIQVFDVWTLSLASQPPQWTRLALTGGPSLRYGHVAAYDPLRHAVVIFGGYYFPGGLMSDAWVLWLGADPHWEPVEPVTPGPVARDFAGAVWDAPNDRFVLFGGNGLDTAFGDTWTLQLGAVPIGAEPGSPGELSFAGAQPNPCRGAPSVSFTLPREANVRVDVFDVAGRLVLSRSGRFAAGAHRLEPGSGGALPPGLYLARFEALGERRSRRFAVIR